MRFSIRTKLAAAFLVLAIVPMAAVAYYNLTHGRKEVERLSTGELTALARSTAASIEQLLTENLYSSATLAGNPLVVQFMTASEGDRRVLRPQVDRLLRNFVDNHPDYDTPGLLDERGIVLAALEEGLVGTDRSFRDYFRTSVGGRPYISNITVGRLTGRPGVFITNPIVSGEGRIVGIDLVWLKAETIWKIIDEVKVGEQGIAYLLDPDGVIVAHPDRTLLFRSLGKLGPEAVAEISSTLRFGVLEDTGEPVVPESLGIEELAAGLSSAPGPASFRYFSPLDGGDHVVGFATLGDLPWTVVVDLPEAQFLGPVRRMRFVALVSIGAAALAAIVLSLLLARNITMPLRRLTDAVREVKEDLPFSPSSLADVAGGGDELALLARGLSGMILSRRESENRYRDLMENAPMGVYQVTREGRFVLANRKMAGIFGYGSPQEFAAEVRNVEELYARPAERAELLEELDARGLLRDREVRMRRRDGRLIWTRINSRATTGADGTRVYEGLMEDITESRRVKEELIRSEEKFSAVFRGSPVGMMITSLAAGTVIDVNESLTSITGYRPEELVGTGAAETGFWMSPEDGKTVMGKLREEGSFRGLELGYRNKAGQERLGLFSAERIEIKGEQCVITAVEDVTEKRHLEAQLLQSQKLEAIGTLAGGIAHDFNNLLMGIQGRASLMSVDLGPSHPHAEHLDAIEGYVRSATDLTGQLLGFARGGKYEVEPVDLNALVRKSAEMFGRTRKEIRIHTRLQEPPPVAEADRRQVERALLNLYVNAWQAMPGGGELHLETRAVDFDDTGSLPYEANPGSYASVSVTDTGVGIDEETQKRIFDPFFTTREKSRGTGLGLASVYGIVKNHGGFVAVSSRLNQGATFRIFLPLSRRPPRQEPPADEKLHEGTGTVLLVDDEEMILAVGRAMLESLGYRVVVAESGARAVETVRQAGGDLDLVILDLIMPGMDGGTAFDRIREVRPGIPVILSSGYSVDDQASDILGRGADDFIQKPFSIQQLSLTVRKVLDHARSRGPSADPRA